MKLSHFWNKYPFHHKVLPDGTVFPYRFYQNPKSDQVIVLMTGAIGLSDLMHNLFEQLSRDFSVLTFDYPEDYPDAASFSDALHEVLQDIPGNKWLTGQSLGGLMAPLYACKYPNDIKGLILVNTGSMEKEMSPEVYEDMMKLIRMTKSVRKIADKIPFSLFVKILGKAVLAKAKAGDEKQRQIMEEFVQVISESLTKEYALHMMDLLLSLERERTSRKELESFKGNNLLIFSKGDNTFSEACRRSLIHQMSEPEVCILEEDSHLLLFEKPELFAKKISEFVYRKESQNDPMPDL